eukprot:jgi/Picsp_1/3255/NSC_06095-R1_binding protein
MRKYLAACVGLGSASYFRYRARPKPDTAEQQTFWSEPNDERNKRTDEISQQRRIKKDGVLQAASAIVSSMKTGWLQSEGNDDRISLALARTICSIQQQSSKVSEKGALREISCFMARSFPVAIMLQRAAAGSETVSFTDTACEYLSNAFEDLNTAGALLSRQGNISIILEILRRRPYVAERVWKELEVMEADTLPMGSFGDAMEQALLLDVVGRLRQEENLRRIALRILRCWVIKSNAHISGRVVSKYLDSLATAANAVASSDSASRLEIASIMKVLIRKLPKDSLQHAVPWIWPLLCFAADGVGSASWMLVNESLAAFASCIEAGVYPPLELIETAAFPLLYSIAKEVPKRLDVGVHIADCVASVCLAYPTIPQLQRLRWAELFTTWLVQLDSRKSVWMDQKYMNYRALSESSVDCLSSLLSVSGTEGLQVAHLWLAEMIMHLSQTLKTGKELSNLRQKSSDTESSRTSWVDWILLRTRRGGNNSAGDEHGGGQTYLKGEEARAVANMAEHALATEPDMDTKAPNHENSNWWRYYPRRNPSKPSDAEKPSALKRDTSEERRKHQPKPSDSELSLYINASPIGALYARSIATRLLEASGKVLNSAAELSQSAEDTMSPHMMESYSNMVNQVVDIEATEKIMIQALKVIASLASGDPVNRDWLATAGICSLLRYFLERRHQVESASLVQNEQLPNYRAPIDLLQQISRILAIISIDIGGCETLLRAGLVPYLQNMAASDDCSTSSSAARALLHIESAHRSGYLVNSNIGTRLFDRAREYSRQRTQMLDVGSQNNYAREPTCERHDRDEIIGKQKTKPMSWMEDQMKNHLVLHDGIHLFSPLARHHELLAQQGTNASFQELIDMDVVFLHGIRGGAFMTWKVDGSGRRDQENLDQMDHSICWPSSWLAQRFPRMRLISAEYAAPATGWEGESLPLHATASHLADKLSAAGVGNRPVVFISHSMGGLIVKDIIGRGIQKDSSRSMRKISNACVGTVFYSVPHAGSRLADWGWTLRYIGASPSKAVAHLKTGPHLEEMNDTVKDLCRRGKLAVLSFSEGLPTQLSYLSTHVVPHESAYPGYGEFVVLPNHDHITVCKPNNRQDPAFSVLVEFLAELEKEL